MPLEPFALWLEEVIASDPRDVEEIARIIRIPERRLYDYRERIAGHVALPSAERALISYGRGIKISPERVAASPYQAVLEEQWRNAGGNGTRLTGYLRDAEELVALAGAVIVTVEDLWPGVEA